MGTYFRKLIAFLKTCVCYGDVRHVHYIRKLIALMVTGFIVVNVSIFLQYILLFDRMSRFGFISFYINCWVFLYDGLISWSSSARDSDFSKRAENSFNSFKIVWFSIFTLPFMCTGSIKHLTFFSIGVFLFSLLITIGMWGV